MLILLFFIVYFAGLVTGGVIIWQERRFRKLVESTPEPQVGVTAGSYGPINAYAGTDPDKEAGITMTKTPQQLEAEEVEQLRRAQHGIHS